MTKEELLRPRYKVVADYFYNPYKIGDVITVQFEDRSVLLTETSYKDEFGETVDVANHFNPKRLQDFPHLFKPLQWWEDRRPGDMPKYVKCTNDPDRVIMPGMILRVKWDNSGWGNSGSYIILPYTNCFEPATKEEYEDYLQTTSQLKDGS